MEMHCLPMSHKVITQANCFIPITNAQWEWHIEKMRLSTCAMNHSSLLKQMAQCFYWGPSLLGAELVRGRVCQRPSLSGAEMSRNQNLWRKWIKSEVSSKTKDQNREKRIRWKAYPAKKVVLCIKQQRGVSRQTVSETKVNLEVSYIRSRTWTGTFTTYPHHKSQGFLFVYNILNKDKIDETKHWSQT